MPKFSVSLLASLFSSLSFGIICAQAEDGAAIDQSNALVQCAKADIIMLAINDTAAGEEAASNPLSGQKIAEDEDAAIAKEIAAFETKLDSVTVATKQMVRKMLANPKGTLSKTSTIEISVSYKNRSKTIGNAEKIFINYKGDVATPIKGILEQGSSSWSINGLVVGGFKKLSITPKEWKPAPVSWNDCYNCRPKNDTAAVKAK